MRIRPELAYILPMAVFLGFTLIGGQWKLWYPLSYVIKTGVVAVLLGVLWSCYTRIRWTHGWLGVGVGILGTVQWIGMEQLFMSHDFFSWTRVSFESAEKVRENAFKPYEFFQSVGWMWAFILIRWAGSFLVVPVMEELFWRDFVWRSLASPNDFRLHEVGEYDRSAVWVVPLLFATVHVQWMTAIVWGLLIAWLLLKTRSLGACIIAHGVTNFLLGGYVLFSHYVLGKNEWYLW